MEFHDAAGIFPLDEEHIGELAEDIGKQGLLCPIDTLDGKIIDGRRRFLACKQAKVEPQFANVTELAKKDPAAYAWSMNGPRRHLTPSQKSMAGARMRKYYDDKAKTRQKESKGRGVKKGPANLPDLKSGDARDKAGEAVGVGGRSIDYATKVLDKGEPELVAAVDEGRMAVSTAAILASEPPDVQKQEAKHPKRNRKYYPVPDGGRKKRKSKDSRDALTVAESILSDLEKLIGYVKKSDRGTPSVRNNVIVNMRLAKKYVSASRKLFA